METEAPDGRRLAISREDLVWRVSIQSSPRFSTMLRGHDLSRVLADATGEKPGSAWVAGAVAHAQRSLASAPAGRFTGKGRFTQPPASPPCQAQNGRSPNVGATPALKSAVAAALIGGVVGIAAAGLSFVAVRREKRKALFFGSSPRVPEHDINRTEVGDGRQD